MINDNTFYLFFDKLCMWWNFLKEDKMYVLKCQPTQSELELH